MTDVHIETQLANAIVSALESSGSFAGILDKKGKRIPARFGRKIPAAPEDLPAIVVYSPREDTTQGPGIPGRRLQKSSVTLRVVAAIPGKYVEGEKLDDEANAVKLQIVNRLANAFAVGAGSVASRLDKIGSENSFVPGSTPGIFAAVLTYQAVLHYREGQAQTALTEN